MTDALENIAADAVFDSSGDVFADLNIKLSPEDRLKIEISRAIAARIRERKLTQVDAAKMVGTDQAKISALLRGKLDIFSVERLLHWLLKLGLDVDVRLSRSKRNEPGKLHVSMAA